ncbi:sigma 54-interacting transcriptional regulator [Geomonas azotofigens]|uniref:sigma 54-interacting transcriptional regulator n=1 Tax=Geomonas azotofigens TaxID=2843196 RepID=UPI001C0F834A|nr:sigma 54-interacting transcriptional regulator [Geomonas azotofigens]MBU5613913.1 sigma 54-interacting transcriptional regulator [Geomonas azotofigens]
MIDRNTFFKEVTIKICSSLKIKTALKGAFDYLRQNIPLDSLALTIRDTNLAALRRVAQVATNRVELADEVFVLPEELWSKVQAWEVRAPTIMSADHDEVIRAIAPYIKLEGNSAILIPLWVENEWLGGLILRVRGEGVYDSSHVELLATVTEPFSIALANALAHERLLRYRDTLLDDNSFLNRELLSHTSDEIIGGNTGLRNVMEMVRQVAPLNNSVLLLGETGTGKEVIANVIHFGSPRRDGPFIKVNCGAIPESLIDSELFGHEKGAFTGAVAEKRGRFERAGGGTIFLDEIGELPLQAQVRLLRVLQNREIERVGGSRPIPLDIRVIAASHRNLETMVSENRFREDLWFRLNVFPVIIPPLRQRKEDIPALTRYFVMRKSKELGISGSPAIVPGALQRLTDYSWPGNVRELENIVEREMIRYRGEQLLFDSLLPAEDGRWKKEPPEDSRRQAPLKLDAILFQHISKVLKMTNGKIHGRDGAAALLGVEPNTLRARMDKLGIDYRRKRNAS